MMETPSMQAMVKVAPVGNLGNILVTSEGLALYQWTEEQPGEIKCTEQCAVVWPPVLLGRDTSVTEHVPGVPGAFGVVVRPDETRQLTYNGHALYTFMGDKPGEANCQGVMGWYVLPIK